MPSFKVNTKWAAMSEILPGLFISGVSALKPSDILEKDISCIINATEEVPNLQIPGIDRMKLWLADTEDTDITTMDVVCDHMESVRQEEGRVLVHCVAGVSRSAALCLAYLMKYNQMSLRSAYHLMSARRPMVRPNLGFWRQLIKFEESLRGSTSVRLVDTESFEDGTAQVTPDVYFPIVLPPRGGEGGQNHQRRTTENKENFFPDLAQGSLFADGRERRFSGEKFVPKLDPLPESDTH